jgi:hypothetical protein
MMSRNDPASPSLQLVTGQIVAGRFGCFAGACVEPAAGSGATAIEETAGKATRRQMHSCRIRAAIVSRVAGYR